MYPEVTPENSRKEMLLRTSACFVRVFYSIAIITLVAFDGAADCIHCALFAVVRTSCVHKYIECN